VILTPLLQFNETADNRLLLDQRALFQLKPPSGKFIHREKQHNDLVIQLSPILHNQPASNLFIYGFPGTGKTAIILDIISKLESEAQRRQVPLQSVYINCEENKTDATILSSALKSLYRNRKIPRIGWNRAKLIDEFKSYLTENSTNLIIVLDEIDHTLKHSGDDILYMLSRINDFVESRITTIIISNDVNVSNYIKPRVTSSFGRNKIIFTPYDAHELLKILQDRIPYCFKPNVVEAGLLERIAAAETTKRGDAREALKLLYYCAVVATEERRSNIPLDVFERAQERGESEAYANIVSSLPIHQKILFLSILVNKKRVIPSIDIYREYSRYCSKFRCKPLTDRMVRNFLIYFSEMGLIYTDIGWLKTLKKKTKRISLTMPEEQRHICIRRLIETLS
jgi:cell division control protein 6